MDDEAPIRALLRTALQSDGHQVMDAADGRAGLTLYRQQRVDLVIIDILMPELNGLDTIIELTREFLDVKIIAISGAPSGAGQLGHARFLGACRTFQKPFVLKELLSAVRYQLTH